MARHESDREDLIREAVAMVERAELEILGFTESVTVGFRSNGAMSLFFAQDPVFQFDANARLRRAYKSGFLFRSQHSTLARLHRQRTATETTLQRYDLLPEELALFRCEMNKFLTSLLEQLMNGTFRILRSVPENYDVVSRVISMTENVLGHGTDWLSLDIRARK